jgi:CHAT domain-containing protein/tetratricopeptide (TPR) repeat protein
MNPRLSRLTVTRVVTACLSACIWLAAFAPPSAERAGGSVFLAINTPIEKHVDRDAEHHYQLALAANELASVIVEQHGVDIIVDALDTDGTPIGEFQDEVRPRGEEPIEVAAERAGTYTLIVKPAEGVHVDPDSSYVIRLASRRPATDADRAMRESRTLRVAATRLMAAGKDDEARPMLEQALRIGEQVRGPNDTYVGGVLFQLGWIAGNARDKARTQSFYGRALAVFEQTYGVDHPTSAFTKARLAVIDNDDEHYRKGLEKVESSMAIIERTLGQEHPWYVRCLVTLGNIYENLGDLDKAEAVDRRAMAIIEKIEQTDSGIYADLLNNLGLVRRQKHDYAQADALLRRSLALGEKLRGPESLYVATAYNNLGIVAHDRKDNASAETYYSRALAIFERMLGPNHPDVAQLVNNLGNIAWANGDSARALAMHFRALRIREKTPYHQRLLISVANIARIYAADNDVANAVLFQRRVDTIVEQQLRLNLVIGSERQKLAIAQTTAERTDRTLSLNLYQAHDDPDASALAALVLLQRKGRVLDAMTDTFAAARQRVADASDRDLLDQLKSTTADLARLAFNPPERMSADDRQQQIEQLASRKEALESDLSKHSAAYRAELQPVTLDAVQAAIPDDAALVEFAVFRPFDPKIDGNDAYGAPHYAAYVLRTRGTPVGFDLGPAQAIHESIDALRAALRDPLRTDVKKRARAVDDQIMRPLRASVGEAKRLLISPDGDLNLVPFEALADERGHYLVERYAVSYLTSGRDLLRMQVARAHQGPPTIVADPLFGNLEKYRRSRAADEASTMSFVPLGSTAAEARAIKRLFPEASLLMKRQATKAALQQLQAPRLLHIASHGFFLDDTAAPDGTRAANGNVKMTNPLVRSGIALAGANRRGAADAQHDDGILTALEASSLNLWGTKLVTLSACDTGVGEVRNGEGVYGLRRAFVLAGAETMVMSLWPVSDYITREIMTSYYTGLRAGLGRGDALRKAKLAMLQHRGRRHPFYWASFIQSGEWANLDGAR